MSIMKNLFVGFAFLFALVFGSVSFANAQETTPSTDQNAPVQRGEGFRKFKGERGFGGKHHGGDKMMFKAMDRLNLTEDQRAQVKTIFETNRQANQPQMEEMHNLMMQKRNGATLTTEQENRFKDLREQMQLNGKKTKADILAILTPEQRDQLEKMKAEMRQKREQFRQQRQAPPTTTEKPTDN
jgi:periplasmic protein CpxP/Spy